MTHPFDPDRTVDRLLREDAHWVGEGASSACVQPEAVAAWLSGGLSASEADAVEAHVAGCGRCQALVAALARAETAAASAPVSLPAARARMAPRWVLPAAAAAVLVVGVWVGRGLWSSPPSPELQLTRVESPVETRADDVGVANSELAERAVAADKDAPARADAFVSRPSAAPEPPATPPATAAVPSARTTDADKVSTAPERERRRASALEAKAPAADGIAAVAESVPGDARQADTQRSNSAALAAAPAAPPALRRAERVAELGLVIVSPDAQRRWRASARGLERSVDGGAGWAAADGGDVPAVDLRAGTSPSLDVCWFVGRAGLVLVSTDGRRFVRVAGPEGEDLVSIEATDGSTAVVRSVQGRQWRTTDQGRTWTASR